MSKIIIAKYKENVDWVKNLPENFEPIIIDKENDKDLPNLAGREAHTYLHYIYTNYDDLKGEYVFCQGNPFDHSPEFFQEISQEIPNGYQQIGNWHLESRPDGTPHHPGLPIEKYCIDLELPMKDLYPFTAGAQFKITANKLKSYSKDWYKKALELSETDSASGYVFERLWQTMYNNIRYYTEEDDNHHKTYCLEGNNYFHKKNKFDKNQRRVDYYDGDPTNVFEYYGYCYTGKIIISERKSISQLNSRNRPPSFQLEHNIDINLYPEIEKLKEAKYFRDNQEFLDTYVREYDEHPKIKSNLIKYFYVADIIYDALPNGNIVEMGRKGDLLFVETDWGKYDNKFRKINENT